MLSSLLVLVSVSASVQALAFNAPRATITSPAEVAKVPQPTEAPPLAELLKRQASGDEWTTALIGTGSLCGYLGAASGSAYHCGDEFTCNMVVGSLTGTSTSYGELACCNTAFCGIRTTCVDYTGYWSSSLCGDDCQTNSLIAKCTALSAPYCNGVRFPNELAQDWYCNTVDISTWQLAYTTTAGEADDRGFVLTSWDSSPTSSVFFESASLSASGSATGAAPAAPITVTMTASPMLPTMTSPTSPTSPTSTTAGPPAGQSPKPVSKKSTPTGAIVGGVVGGVVAIAAVAAIAWWICGRKRKSKSGATTNSTVPTYTGIPNPQQSSYPDPVKPQPQMSQHEAVNQGNPGGLVAGYYKPYDDQSSPLVHEADSNPTSPGVGSGNRMSNATELESRSSPTPSHAVSAVASTMTHPQQQMHHQSPSDEIHEMSATSGPWPGSLEEIHEMPNEHQAGVH
ncbi:MAG: hypothetical protein M1818_003950 [Claussenomyces sp. TS43310]|nr:MAG: hypothetical protein M1818_003950 [Claussenomyces sp. TS43310]